MLNYQTHVDSGSMFNTPPVVPIYAALQTLRWIKAQGGVKEMERCAIEKADMLYARKPPTERCPLIPTIPLSVANFKKSASKSL